MPLNLGYIEAACAGGDVVVRIYYQQQPLDNLLQPLVDGPRGRCLDVTNRDGDPCRIVLCAGSAAPMAMTPAAGDPVSGQSKTAAQMLLLGFASRQSIGELQLWS